MSHGELIRRGSSKGETTNKINYIHALFEDPCRTRAVVDVTRLSKSKINKLMVALMNEFTVRRESQGGVLRRRRTLLVVEKTWI